LELELEFEFCIIAFVTLSLFVQHRGGQNVAPSAMFKQ